MSCQPPFYFGKNFGRGRGNSKRFPLINFWGITYWITKFWTKIVFSFVSGGMLQMSTFDQKVIGWLFEISWMCEILSIKLYTIPKSTKKMFDNTRIYTIIAPPPFENLLIFARGGGNYCEYPKRWKTTIFQTKKVKKKIFFSEKMLPKRGQEFLQWKVTKIFLDRKWL